MAKKLVMGNEAFAYAALAAGVRVVAGYPGTPSSEVIETIAAEHAAGRAEGVHVEWSVNEKVALELLEGASAAGARTLFTCKQVGLNVASDPLLSLNYVGVKGGLVLFVADDPGPISSQTEQDTRRFASFAKVPVLDPSTLEEGVDMIGRAFDLSEHYGTPVIVRSTTRICHSSAFIDVPETTSARDVEGFERSPRWVIFPRRAFEAHGEINDRLRAISQDWEAEPWSQFNPGFERPAEGASSERRSASDASRPLSGQTAVSANPAAPLVGIAAGGVSAAYAREALRMLEERCGAARVEMPAYRFIQFGTVYPFPEETAAWFTQGLEAVLVLEELDHVIEDDLLAHCGRTHAAYDVCGKLTGHAQDRGENTVDGVYDQIAAFFGIADDLAQADTSAASASESMPDSVRGVAAISETASGSAPVDGVEDSSASTATTVAPATENIPAPALPPRPPVLCAGCPHRGSFYAIKRALKQTNQEGIFCGDIGCYTLGNAQPLDAVDTCLCMGAGITMAQGFSIVEPGKRQLAFVGDSTFFASGLPGIVNAVYNNHDITVVVLDNSITAMTGAQPNPGTGITLMGAHNPPISIEAVLRAVGFETITRANPFKLEESIEAAKEALAASGPSAIIYEGPCITLVKPDVPIAISVDTCTGCRKCITEIGCPAIGFDAQAKKAFVNESLCTGCGLCVQICPFDAISLPLGSASGKVDGVDSAAGASAPAPAGSAEVRRSSDPGSKAGEADA